jgi:hypothetical protein
MRTQLQVNQAVQVRSQIHRESIAGVVVSFTHLGVGVWFPQLPTLPKGFEPETRVQFRYCDYAGVHTAVTVVLQAQPGPRSGILLKAPERFITTQKRRFFRQVCSLPAPFRVLTLPQPRSSGEEDPDAIIEDLSAGGARIRTRLWLAMDDRIALTIQKPPEPQTEDLPSPKINPNAIAALTLHTTGLPHPQLAKPAPPEAIPVKARVLRIRLDTFGDLPTYTMGVEFVSLGVSDQDRLVAFVFGLQKNQPPTNQPKK